MTTTDKPTSKLTTPMYQKVFSLTKGARFLKIGKATLKGAIERGEVKATQNTEGHYEIPAAAIFQYEANLIAERSREVSDLDLARRRAEQDTPGRPEVEMDSQGSSTLVTDSTQTRSGTVTTIPLAVYEETVDFLKQEVRERKLEAADWKSRADKYEERTVALLTHQKQEQPPSETVPKRAGWRLVAGVLIGLVLALALWYRVPLVNWLYSLISVT